MIELEIQGLSERRDGLLIDVGRLAVANGFTLQRQRLAQDAHGILLTMVVRGPERKRRALEAALDGYDRLISFQLAPFVDGEAKPHFAASRSLPRAPVAPAPTPASVPAPPVAAPAAAAPVSLTVPPVIETPASVPSPSSPLVIERTVAVETVHVPVAYAAHEDDVEFLRRVSPARAPAPAPAAPLAAPFVEVVPLEADESAVEKVLRELDDGYAQIVPRLLTLDRSVAAGARESSLFLAGQRTGAWVGQRDYAALGRLDLHEAIERIGVPSLRTLFEVEQDSGQLHIRHSPLCTADGHSGCRFFSGFLDGVLAPVVFPGSVSIFEVCCRSYGADECVLAISD